MPQAAVGLVVPVGHELGKNFPAHAASRARLTESAMSFTFMATSFLEADFLERLGGVPVQACGFAVVTTTSREIPECNPRLRPVADRRQLLSSRVSRPEAVFRLLE